MIEVEIADQQQRVAADHDWLTALAEFALAQEGVTDATLSVALLTNKQIHQVNRQFLQHDYATDVITFLYSAGTAGAGPDEADEPADASDPSAADGVEADADGADEQGVADADEPDEGEPPLTGLVGEVIISAEFAATEADKLGIPVHQEIGLYLVHGILHLCGFDDQEADAKAAMDQRQDQLLADFCAQRPTP